MTASRLRTADGRVILQHSHVKSFVSNRAGNPYRFNLGFCDVRGSDGLGLRPGASQIAVRVVSPTTRICQPLFVPRSNRSGTRMKRGSCPKKVNIASTCVFLAQRSILCFCFDVSVIIAVTVPEPL